MKEKIKKLWQHLPNIVIFAILAVLLFFFFVNDFGLVDIHKTSVVVAVGIDADGDDLVVTAQIALPQPSENGENTSYTEVVGKGATVADALNEINSKTGFYPKLLFCRLIILGEDCKDKDLFEVLDYFYRNEYVQYSALVAFCSGKAGDLLSKPMPTSDTTTLSIQRILSEELKKSANVSTVNLKMIAQTHYSKSNACYMPYIESSSKGMSYGGEQSGENFNIKPPQESGNGQQKGGADSNGSGGEQGGGGSSKSSDSGGEQGGKSGQSSGREPNEFTCRKTAAFSGGKFVGVLTEEQAFALNLLKNQIRLAIVSAQSDGKDYAVGLKNNSGNIKFKMQKGVPVLSLNYKAKARIQGVTQAATPKQLAQNDIINGQIIEATKTSLTHAMQSFTDFCIKNDCDLLGAKDLLYKFNNVGYESLNDGFLNKMHVAYNIKISGAR